MIVNKSTALAFAGLVLCIANTVSAALVAPVLKSPANKSENVSPKNVTLDWAPAKSAGGYEYVVRDSKGKVVKEGALPATKTAVRLNLDYEQTYKWKVRSTRATLNPSTWSTTWSFSTAPHARPLLVAPADGSTGIGSVQPNGWVSVVLEWTALNGSSQYELQVSSDPSFAGAPTRIVNGTSTEQLMDKAGRVYWRLRSLALADKPYWSATRSFDPVSPRGIPEVVSPRPGDVVGGGSIPMTWSGVAGVSSYTWTLYAGTTVGSAWRVGRAVPKLSDKYEWTDLRDCPSIGFLTLQVTGGGKVSDPKTFAFKSVAPELRNGKWGNYSRYYLSWSRVGGNQGYEVTFYKMDETVLFTRQVSRNKENYDLPSSQLPKAGFKYSVKATGFDGIVSDSSAILTEGPWGN